MGFADCCNCLRGWGRITLESEVYRGWNRFSPGAGHADLPHPDQVVAVSGEQSLAIAGPGQGGALGGLSTGGPSHLGPQVLHLVLALEVPDLDGGATGGAQPVPVRREHQGVDDVMVLQSVEMLVVSKVPEHGLAVLASTGAQGAIRAEGDGVKVPGVTHMVGLQLAVGQVPDLDILVPSGRDNDGIGVVRREPDTADPVGVTLITDGVLALGQGVPQLDGLVPAGGHNLPVVGGEGHGQHVLGVVLEPAGGLPGAQVPETEVLVPGAGESKVSIRGEDNIGHEVGVAVESLLGNSILTIF